MKGGDEVYQKPPYQRCRIHSSMVLCNNVELNKRATNINRDRACGKKFLARG